MHRSAKLGLYGLVLAGLVGGTLAWASADKAVTVSVDGQARTIHTTSKTVGAALADAKIPVGGHDALAPSSGSSIQNNGHIVLLRGRLLHLNVDGHRKDVWTTARSVDEALSQLGYGRSALIGVSRSRRLPLTPTQLSLITPKHVLVTADKKNQTVVTTDATVGSVLASLHIAIGKYDKLSAPRASNLTNNQHVVLRRVKYSQQTTTAPLPYETNTTKDPDSYEGTTTVVVAGKPGEREQTVQYVYVDGKLAGKRIISTRVTEQPTAQQEKVGTKKPTATPATGGSSSSSGSSSSGSSSSGGSSGSGGGSDPAPSGDPQTIAKSLVSARGWGDGEFGCLVNLWNRESGWNVHAANPSGAYGIPQALPGSKMATAGPDWQNNATTQITWGLNYISGVYGSPCNAWAHSNSTGWY